MTKLTQAEWVLCPAALVGWAKAIRKQEEVQVLEGQGATYTRVLQEHGLPRWHQGLGVKGDWQSAIHMPTTASWCEGLGAPVHENFELGTLDLGEVPIQILTRGRWPSEMQFLNWHWFLAMDAELAEALEIAIWTHYPGLQDTFDFFTEEDRARCLPPLASPEDLRQVIALTDLVLHDIPHASTPYVGAIFRCTWDEEHGLGLLLHGTEVLSVGAADTAVDHDLAMAHREAFLAKLKSQA